MNFRISIFLIISLMSSSLLSAQKFYTNPVIHADYSDPDLIRVGDDYYMTASSFSHIPGLPVLHSKDLVHWKLIGHAVQNYPDTAFLHPSHGNGIWAPSIRFHKGEFYIYYGDPDRGIYMTKTKNPAGPWSDLKLIHPAKGWIDCCPLWDEDGRVYLVHAYAKSRAGIKSKMAVAEMNATADAVIGEDKLIFDGTITHPTLEGPKLYKRNGFYYIFAPAGGVKFGWQSVFRSKNIYGPYEDKTVLEQGLSPVNGPHQGGWVTTPKGEDWFVHFQDKFAYGRIVHLQPMSWKNDWPVMGVDKDQNGIGEPVSIYRMPESNYQNETTDIQTSDEFNTEKLGFQWQWQCNPDPSWMDMNKNTGKLRLQAVNLKASDVNLWTSGNLLMQKFPADSFEVKTKLDLQAMQNGTKAGLIVFGYDYAHISIEKIQNKLKVSQINCLDARKKNPEETIESKSFSGNQIYLKLNVMQVDTLDTIPVAVCTFSYSKDGGRFYPLGKSFYAKEGHWVGAKMGLFAVTNGAEKSAVDVDWFRVNTFEKRIAFPGAEGFGKYTVGGRGGKILYVNSLEDNDSVGTLRWAVKQKFPRTILFNVSGTISLKSPLNINNSYLTIAGQSAPGDGITIKGFPVNIKADEVIIRYLRVRLGDLEQLGDAGSDAMGGNKFNHVIIDHCSISWSTDECASFYHLKNFSFQWNIISESLRLSKHIKGPHGYGGIWGGQNASFHHNLLASHDSRTPRLGVGTNNNSKDTVDLRNNVIFNWSGNGCYGGEGMKVNIVDNYFRPGPATYTQKQRTRFFLVYERPEVLAAKVDRGKYFVSGNLMDNYLSDRNEKKLIQKLNADNWTFGVEYDSDASAQIVALNKAAVQSDTAFAAADIVKQSAADAYKDVLKNAGCSKVRDNVDLRIIREVISGKPLFKGKSPFNGKEETKLPDGKLIKLKSENYPLGGIIDSQNDLKPSNATADWTAWPVLKSAPAPVDTDADGIPDLWEIKNNLDPKNPDDAGYSTDENAFTPLEKYLESLITQK